MKFYRVPLVIAELLPFDCLNFNDFSVLSHYLVTYGWNFMKRILNKYHHIKALHVKFYPDAVG